MDKDKLLALIVIDMVRKGILIDIKALEAAVDATLD
jgi:hypothetical protein